MRGYNVKVNGKSFFVEIEEAAEGQKTVAAEQPKAVQTPVEQPKAVQTPVAEAKSVAKDGFKMNSPLPGLILRLNVQSGATVKKNDKLLVLEAMKMEHEILAAADGKVSFLIKQGDTVESGAPLAIIS